MLGSEFVVPQVGHETGTLSGIHIRNLIYTHLEPNELVSKLLVSPLKNLCSTPQIISYITPVNQFRP